MREDLHTFLERARAHVPADTSGAELEEIVRRAVHMAYARGLPLTPEVLEDNLARVMGGDW